MLGQSYSVSKVKSRFSARKIMLTAGYFPHLSAIIYIPGYGYFLEPYNFATDFGCSNLQSKSQISCMSKIGNKIAGDSLEIACNFCLQPNWKYIDWCIKSLGVLLASLYSDPVSVLLKIVCCSAHTKFQTKHQPDRWHKSLHSFTLCMKWQWFKL